MSSVLKICVVITQMSLLQSEEEQDWNNVLSIN